MSNIYTSFLRIIPRPDRSIGRDEAEWIIGRGLNERGSYNVPVAVRLANDGSLLDIQAGCAKNPGFYDLWGGAPRPILLHVGAIFQRWRFPGHHHVLRAGRDDR